MFSISVFQAGQALWLDLLHNLLISEDKKYPVEVT